MGLDGEVFRLADGSFWKVASEYEYLYEYYPSVVVCPSLGKLLVDGKFLNIEPVGVGAVGPRSRPGGTADVIQSRIDGDFEGWEGDTIFVLENGQIWQQSRYAYKYRYRFRPRVTIIKIDGHYEMQVDGVDTRVRVQRLQ